MKLYSRFRYADSYWQYNAIGIFLNSPKVILSNAGLCAVI